MDKSLVKYFVDVGLAISFFVSFVTGMMKLSLFSRAVSPVFRLISFRWFSFVHDWSGVIMGLLVLVHLIMNWSWIVGMTKRMVGGKKWSG